MRVLEERALSSAQRANRRAVLCTTVTCVVRLSAGGSISLSDLHLGLCGHVCVGVLSALYTDHCLERRDTHTAEVSKG